MNRLAFHAMTYVFCHIQQRLPYITLILCMELGSYSDDADLIINSNTIAHSLSYTSFPFYIRPFSSFEVVHLIQITLYNIFLQWPLHQIHFEEGNTCTAISLAAKTFRGREKIQNSTDYALAHSIRLQSDISQSLMTRYIAGRTINSVSWLYCTNMNCNIFCLGPYHLIQREKRGERVTEQIGKQHKRGKTLIQRDWVKCPHEFIYDNDFDMICLTETWHREGYFFTMLMKQLRLDTNAFFKKLCSHGHSVGLLVLQKDCIILNPMAVADFQSFECLAFKCKQPNP